MLFWQAGGSASLLVEETDELSAGTAVRPATSVAPTMGLQEADSKPKVCASMMLLGDVTSAAVVL